MSQWGQITTTHSRGHALMGKHPRKPGNHPPVPITISVTASARYDEESSLERGLSIPGRYRGICGASPDVPFCWA